MPQQVVDRLDAGGVDVGVVRRGKTAHDVRFKPEIRVDWDKRNAEINGYATVYEHAYDVAGGPPLGWRETIRRGAAAQNVLARDDVRFLVNHDGIPLARTRAGTMALESDDIGLRVHVPALDLRSPDAMSFVMAVLRGDMDEMSFAFRVGRQEWNSDFTERFIIEFDEILDVSGVSFPANPATVMTARGDNRAPGGGRRRRSSQRSERTELRALPDEVLTRGLDLADITTLRRGQEFIEARRSAPDVAVSHRDDSVVVDGYVAVYDEPAQVAGEDGWTEIWAPGACARSVGRNPDVRLTLNDDGEPLARSKAGTLELTSDDYGLHLRATINPESPRGEDAVLAMQRGDKVDVRIGFDVVKQRWDDDHGKRTVEEIYLHDIAFLTERDPRAADGLAELHNSRSLVDCKPDGQHMSLDLAKAHRDSFAV